VKVTLVPSSVSRAEESRHLQFLSTYLINDTLAIDAGCIGLYRSPLEQARVRHILISHTHMDHIASLPVFLENVHALGHDCVTIHGSAAVLDCLRQDLFNDRVWPNFIAYSVQGIPFLKLALLQSGQPVELEGLTITPVAVNHVVPTLGFIVADASSAVVIPGDTGPTEEIWQLANDTPHLKAVFLEASFPDRMAALAARAKHLTPALFAQEVKKLRRQVLLVAIHVKALFHDQIVQEMDALGLANLTLARFGETYEF
jgi:ribonuclease BN (tRNA processing enzyme)